MCIFDKVLKIALNKFPIEKLVTYISTSIVVGKYSLERVGKILVPRGIAVLYLV